MSATAPVCRNFAKLAALSARLVLLALFLLPLSASSPHRAHAQSGGLFTIENNRSPIPHGGKLSELLETQIAEPLEERAFAETVKSGEQILQRIIGENFRLDSKIGRAHV